MKIAVVILAAGLGTRMKSNKAKVLHKLLGKELVCYPVELALKLKADKIVVVLGHQAKEVDDLLSSGYAGKVETVLQKEQLGTGHAVLMAEKALKGFSGQVLILSGDVPLLQVASIRALLKTAKNKKSPFALISTKLDDATGYGRIVRVNENIEAIVEHKDANREERKITECNMGIYVSEKKFMFSMLKKVGTNNKQGEYYLPDLVKFARLANKPVASILANETETMGINNRVQLAYLEACMRMQINTKLMLSGVSLEDPKTTYISENVKIGQDTIIEANCRIQGKSAIGKGCLIQTGSVITDSKIENNVQIKPYTVIEESIVKSEAILGPYTHLRPQSKIGERCHVGNFVETKKTTLKPGAKANHLSYLGDAVIGEKSNIGAGTITCNYDGYNKYKTKIGKQVLVGSDTQLIAPISIPDRVVLGAGTSIDKKSKLKKGVLVITRPELQIIEGYRDKLEALSCKTKKTKKTKKSKKK